MRRDITALVMALILCLGFGLAAARAAESEEVVFLSNFQGQDGKKIEDLGWTKNATDQQSTWEIKNGMLEVTCFNNPYKGGNIRVKVPFVSKGELSFDVNINSKGSGGYNHFSLQVGIYSLSTAFNGYGKNGWMRHRLAAPGETQWATVANSMPKGKTVKCKIRFDNSKETVEYYCGDMENPSYVDQGIKLIAPVSKPAEIWIGNYGVATDAIVNRIGNIKLVSFDGKPVASVEPEPKPRTGRTTVYRGFAFERYRLDEILNALNVKDVRTYTMLNGITSAPGNSLSLDRLPSVLSPVTNKLIIMADLPLGPKNAVPEVLRQSIKNNVADGAHLVIFGGLFTLDKGEFAGSVLEELLPVKINGVWSVTKADNPLPIDKSANGDQSVASVFYYHNLAPLPDARVLASAEGHPLVVSRQFGKGVVTVFAAVPCGTSSGRALAFWKWNGWPGYAAQMICKADELFKPGNRS